jgi:hypothetical protein
MTERIWGSDGSSHHEEFQAQKEAAEKKKKTTITAKSVRLGETAGSLDHDPCPDSVVEVPRIKSC